MATRTKKPSQPPPEPVPPPTDDEIAGRLRSLVAEERTKLGTLKIQFLARTETSAAFAIEGLGTAIVEQEAELNTWGILGRWLDRGDAPLVECLSSVLAEIREEEVRILSFRLWEANSTSAFANAVRMHAISGRVRALEMIAVHVEVAMAQVEARDKGEA